jgi:hypothetical protein
MCLPSMVSCHAFLMCFPPFLNSFPNLSVLRPQFISWIAFLICFPSHEYMTGSPRVLAGAAQPLQHSDLIALAGWRTWLGCRVWCLHYVLAPSHPSLWFWPAGAHISHADCQVNPMQRKLKSASTSTAHVRSQCGLSGPKPRNRTHTIRSRTTPQNHDVEPQRTTNSNCGSNSLRKIKIT